MISPLSFIWRQLNGPQIAAICAATWKYFHDTYDSILEYFRTFSIETATDDHLTVIGVWQGLARPLVPVPQGEVFFFTEVYGYIEDPDNPGHLIPDSSYPSVRGFAEVPSSFTGTGGKFAGQTVPGDYTKVPAAMFRSLLRANSDSEGYLGSLIALDDMLYSLWRRTHSAVAPDYTFEWSTLEAHPTYTPGDIFVDLGMTGDWEYPYETQAEVKLLGKTIYYPIPKLIPILHEGDSSADPLGFVRILVRSEEDVYGLDAMWAGEGTPSDTVDNGEEPEWDVSPITIAELTTMWGTGSTWIDVEGPAEDFYPISEEDLGEMWNG